MRLHQLRWVIAGWLVGGGLAHADDGGYQIDHHEPTPAGDPFLVIESPWYASTRRFAAGVSLDYAHGLVRADVDAPPGMPIDAPSPISHAGTAHLDLAIALGARLALDATVPLLLDQAGTAFAGVAPHGTTIGDPRLGARARLVGGAIAVDASAYAWIPLGVEDSYAGDASARGLARLTASGATDTVRWAVNAGFLARKTAVLSTLVAPDGNTVGSEVQVGAAAAYLAMDQRLSVGPEALLAIGVADLPASQARATLELYGAARYQLDDRLALAVGGGSALFGGPAPDARVLLSLSYAPVAPRGSRFERVIVLPDEDGHVGAVEVDDGKHKALLDKAYASSEISRQRRQVTPVQQTADALPPAAVAVAKSLPPRDRDGDDVADADDACPDRPGAASTDPLRRGCPPAVEKVVVLPDEDGHVGGVEIDDGRGKTVLATAYATAEVGADGSVAPVAPAPSKALERAVAEVATALPPPDADGDNIRDLDDACPDRAGAPSTDPLRHGCPAAVERVVVVPDADGHVGGVELDDGHTTTVIDRAYAAAEVAADGTAHAVDPISQTRSVDRAIAGLAKALPILDADGDQIADDRDACPDRAGPTSRDPLRDGCPALQEKVVLLPSDDGHVGGLDIEAGGQTVVLDQPYASAEITGGQAQVQPAATPVALVRATQTLARALPISDRDDDGIADGDDACPTRPGPTATTPVRNGCPRTVEQVVVLPDENGTVGAVEVDDGTSVTLLDQQYAAAEVGADGRTHALPAEPSEVSARYAEALAARPPGARIILYFTAGSQPARDLTGPLDNLVAEVRAKGTFEIDIVGHTDQTGSERQNVKIGQQRAQVIADRLIAAGLPKEHIHVSSKGSREPAVKRRSRRIVELRNRRVEIWVR